MKTLAIIPARGGSKEIPNQNVTLLNGKPLIAYTIDAALAARGLDRVIVSTDDQYIAKVAQDYGATAMMRPAFLATDCTPTLPVLQDVVSRLLREDSYQPDAVMTLQPTSPLRTSSHIDKAIDLFAADPQADSLVSCITVPHRFHPLSIMQKTDDGYIAPFIDQVKTPLRRQDKRAVFARNGAAIYITRISCLDRFIFGGNLLPFMMDESVSHDVDTMEDLFRIEQILKLEI